MWVWLFDPDVAKGEPLTLAPPISWSTGLLLPGTPMLAKMPNKIHIFNIRLASLISEEFVIVRSRRWRRGKKKGALDVGLICGCYCYPEWAKLCVCSYRHEACRARTTCLHTWWRFTGAIGLWILESSKTSIAFSSSVHCGY